MLKTLFVTALVCLAGAAQAATFSSRATFESALDSATTIDVSDYIGLTTLNPAVAIPGAEFFGPDALFRSDNLIQNGQGFYGTTTPHVGLNFTTDVNAVGVQSNLFDGGRIQLFSGQNGTGTLLGEIGFDVNFAALSVSSLVGSVLFTCDFNFDLKCGLIDPIFGLDKSALSTTSAIPLPAALPLLLAGLGGLGIVRRRRG